MVLVVSIRGRGGEGRGGVDKLDELDAVITDSEYLFSSAE